jgi:hypothetical protein
VIPWGADKLMGIPGRRRSRVTAPRAQASVQSPHAAAGAVHRVGLPRAVPGQVLGVTPRRIDDALGSITYTCSCGYVFGAPVVTSVACPHCGTAQAW